VRTTWAPIPYWLKTIAVAESIGMVLPVVAFMMNIFLTMRGNWNRFNLGDRTAWAQMIRPPAPYVGSTDPIPYPEVSATSDQPQGWPTWRAADLQAGKEIYVDYCLTCHGCAGNGLGSYAGTLAVTPANYGQEPFRSMPDEEWFWHVSEGLPGTVMPTWRESLSEEERWQVIRYVQQIFARPVMHDPDEGDPPAEYADLTNPLPLTVDVLDQGKHIFIRECMVCHGDAGRGHGPYRAGLQPSPPDFGDGSYGDYTDADYFWRVSEGVPWTAMPTWRLQYDEEDRWALVHYLRTLFTQTEDRPPEPGQDNMFEFPDVYHGLDFPETVSYDGGRTLFLQHCAHCHGLPGNGMGWDGQYLNPTPADFREMSGMTMGPDAVGEHLAKVTFGIRDTAMPSWGEFLTEDQRYDLVFYIMQSFMAGRPSDGSVYSEGQVAAQFATASRDVWVSEGNVVSPTHGADLYAVYCQDCHGADGQGNGPGTEGSASGGPAAFPANLPEGYIFWRMWEGVPDGMMYPFQWLLSEREIWDITVHVEQLTSTGQGGGQ
jgi:mono/diheme cytochrome c family protein